MPKYQRKVELPGKSADFLYEKVSKEIDRFLSKGELKLDYKLHRNEAKKCFEVKSKLFSAILQCKDSAMELDVNLSLFAVPFRGKIDSAIDRWLAKTFS